MKNKTCLVLVMLFVMFISINVYAEGYLTIEKSDGDGELYNSMPTSVKKGDIVSVKIILKEAKDMNLSQGESSISYDRNAFEIIESDDKYYKKLNDNIDNVGLSFNRDGSFDFWFSWNEEDINSDSIDLVELKFKVKKDINDGIYYISQNYNYEGLTFYDDEYNEIYGSAWKKILKFQVGKSKITSNYSKDDISSSSYIIGTNLFTRNGSDEYDGVLTTEYIMLASKSIKSDKKDDMIIYAKNARGKWINAITAEEITPPDDFKIQQIDMKANYLESGFYTDSNDKTIVRFIQINDKEALVTIENENVRVHGIASVTNKVATLTIDNKNYRITISDDSINIDTNNSYITNGRLQKKSNASLNDYLNDYYGHMEDDGNPLLYMKSNQTGKYSNGKSEMYFVRTYDDGGMICMKENGSTKCNHEGMIGKGYYYSDYDVYYETLEESTYIITLDEVGFGLNMENSEMNVICEGNCTNSPYVGKFQKQSSLSLEDIIHLFEKNEVIYRVTFDENNGEEPWYVYIPSGSRLTDRDYWFSQYEPNKEGHIFVEWQLDGSAYPFGTPITKPITLVAKYEKVLSTPTLSVVSNDYNENSNIVNYTLKVESDEHFDGFTVYQQTGPNEPVGFGGAGTSGTIIRDVGEGNYSQYYAITYKDINGYRYFSPKSNTISLNASVYTVTFNPNNETSPLTQKVLYGNKVAKPENPKKDGYAFVEWQLNEEPYNFATPVTDNITLVANWEIKPSYCYYNSGDSTYVWTTNPNSSWILMPSLNSSELCVSPTQTNDGTIASCPNCKFMYTTNDYYFGGANNTNATAVANITETVTNDYRTLNKNYFLGFTETQDGKINKAFACGIKGENPSQGIAFCIEGGTQQTDNFTILNNLYGQYNSEIGLGCEETTTSIQCNGIVSAFNNGAYGDVNVNSNGVNCSVNSDYTMHCFEN